MGPEGAKEGLFISFVVRKKAPGFCRHRSFLQSVMAFCLLPSEKQACWSLSRACFATATVAVLPCVELMIFLQHYIRKLKRAVAASGICWGGPEENSGKITGKLLENVPESRNALNSSTSGTGKGKPAANLWSTLPGTLSKPSMAGVFEIDSYNLLEFYMTIVAESVGSASSKNVSQLKAPI